jgi:hypothetical protein
MRGRMRRSGAVAATMFGLIALGILVGPALDARARPQQAGAAKPAPVDVKATLSSVLAKGTPKGIDDAIKNARASNPKGRHEFGKFARKMLQIGLDASQTPAAGAPVVFGGPSPVDAVNGLKAEDFQALMAVGAQSLSGTRIPPNIKQIRQKRIKFGAGIGPTKPAAPAGTANQPSFDFRSMKVISQVNNQDSCGCCWAFSTIGNYEALTAIFNGGELIKFSEQYLLNCTPPDTSVPSIQNDCNGGFWGDALDLMKAGVPYIDRTNPNDPWIYTGVKVPCPGAPPKLFQVSDWEFVDPDPNPQSLIPTQAQIKQALCTYGPIIVGVKGGTFLFSTYTGGVLIENDQSQPDHALLIIGWDDNAENTGQGAWLIKNSWGDTWGFNGFGYVGYQTNSIGFQATYVIPVLLQ